MTLDAFTVFCGRLLFLVLFGCGLQTLVDSKTLEKMPLDPWGHTFAYVVESGQPIVTSYGRDGIPGGEGLDADITSRPGHTQ